MAGTVKLCVPPELVLEELVERGVLVACTVVVADRLGSAECTWVGEGDGVGDDEGVSVTADVGDPPAEALGDPP